MLVRALSFIVFLLKVILHPLLLVLAIPMGLLAGSLPLAAGLGVVAGALRIIIHYLFWDTKLTAAVMIVTLIGGAAVACIAHIARRRLAERA